jgi:transcriptional regulator with XRE-family HTH domain
MKEGRMVRRGRPQGNTASRLGILILQAMKLHHLNYEGVVEESEILARLNSNEDLRIGRSTLGNIVSGRIRQPSAAKLESLAKILQLSRNDVDVAIGLAPAQRLNEQLGRRRSQTHEIDSESITRRRLVRVPILKSDIQLNESQFLNALVDHWVRVDTGYLASLYPPNIKYFVIGESDRFRSPVLPGGTRVLVNTHSTSVPAFEHVRFHLSELFCVKTHRGLTCCYLEHAANNRIALVPHPMSGHFREEYAATDVTIVGQVIGILAPSEDLR